MKTRVRGNFRAMPWNDKRDIHMLTNMHYPPAKGNFCDKHGNTWSLSLPPSSGTRVMGDTTVHRIYTNW
jgi:hypothetical protein